MVAAMLAAGTPSPLSPDAAMSTTESGRLERLSGKKMYFAHIHKTAGRSFVKDLASVVTPCPRLSCCLTQGRDLAALREWWYAGPSNSSCHFQTNEDQLPELLGKLHEGDGWRSDEWIAGAEEPALLSFYRHPLERCRSHWEFMNRLGPKRYSDDEAGHRDFANKRCNETYTSAYSTALGRDSPESVFEWIERNVQFWGITEYYTASLCLFLYQIGHERFACCSCEDAGGGALEEHHIGTRSQNYTATPLSVSDGELAALSVDDLDLYERLRRAFVGRARWVERQSGVRFLCSTGRSEATRLDRRELHDTDGADSPLAAHFRSRTCRSKMSEPRHRAVCN